MPLHRGPLGCDDRENYCIAKGSVAIQLMTAQNTILLCAQAFDGAAARMVEEASAKLHRYARERIEGMGEQHQLALSIDLCALRGLCIPRRANLDTAICRIHVHVGRHPD